LIFNNTDIEFGRKFFSGDSNYITSSTSINNLPSLSLNEVAFAGRSNVGKSSLINALTNRKKLAISSKTPGRTRQLNFFKVQNNSKKLILVDLPGYGYAKVAKKEIRDWIRLTNYYFFDRSCLKTVCLLIDARRKIFSNDLDLMNFFDEIGMSWTLILTKIDKVEKKLLEENKKEILKTISSKNAVYPEIFITSSTKKSGLKLLKAYISSFATN
tara:strand:+ start:12 stop:653 length:642 start_codon:yes stop_codon:yes gene_type:complete